MLSALGLFHSASSVAPSFVPNFSGSGFSVAGVLDDAKAKAKDLEGKASSAAHDVTAKAQGLKEAASKEISKDVSKVKAAAGNGIELYSGKFYAACAVGGIAACGTTHWLVTPLDVVKVRKQIDKNIYKSNFDGWSKIIKNEGGYSALFTGGSPTAIGYSLQGAAKYGFYEYFKKTYADLAGAENAHKYKDLIYLAGSASAEFLADIALVPLETVKVRCQTTFPPFAKGALPAINKVVAKEGVGALYSSLPSLWSRQIPYTMMKFWSFEFFVGQIYARLPKPKSECNKLEQLGVSAVAGYAAGVFCAVVSHPADTMVSKLNAPLKEGQAKPTVGSIYSEIGFGGLWGGLGTRIIMIGTLTALQWLIYDSFKVYVGLPTTGGAAPPPEKK